MKTIYGVHAAHVHRWMRVALDNKPWAVVERCYCGSTRRVCQFFGIEIHNQRDDVWGGQHDQLPDRRRRLPGAVAGSEGAAVA